MKIMGIIRWGIIFALLIAFPGCTGAPVKFNTMPEQPHDLSRGRPITASACGFQLLLVIPISINDRAERAYSDIVSKAFGDYVTNISVQEQWYWAFVGTVYCTEMQAMAYPKIIAPAEAPKQ
jgi:hypothetical protein